MSLLHKESRRLEVEEMTNWRWKWARTANRKEDSIQAPFNRDVAQLIVSLANRVENLEREIESLSNSKGIEKQ